MIGYLNRKRGAAFAIATVLAAGLISVDGAQAAPLPAGAGVSATLAFDYLAPDGLSMHCVSPRGFAVQDEMTCETEATHSTSAPNYQTTSTGGSAAIKDHWSRARVKIRFEPTEIAEDYVTGRLSVRGENPKTPWPASQNTKETASQYDQNMSLDEEIKFSKGKKEIFLSGNAGIVFVSTNIE